MPSTWPNWWTAIASKFLALRSSSIRLSALFPVEARAGPGRAINATVSGDGSELGQISQRTNRTSETVSQLASIALRTRPRAKRSSRVESGLQQTGISRVGQGLAMPIVLGGSAIGAAS